MQSRAPESGTPERNVESGDRGHCDVKDALPFHNAVTWFMTGLIWVVQLLQYLMLASIDPVKLTHSHAFHSRRITMLVAPAMIVEFCLAAFLAFRMATLAAIAEFCLVLVNWAATGLIVRWNWLRTLSWSICANRRHP